MANAKCLASRCNKRTKPGAKYCSSACGYKTREMHERRAKTQCARDACGNPVGPRSTKYCCAECRRRDRNDKALANKCLDCGFPTWHTAQRCRECTGQQRIGVEVSPETRASMSKAARARYGHEGKKDEVLALARAGVKQAEIGRRLGMCQGTVWAIVTFGGWAEYREFKKNQGKRRQGAC